jgi:SH3-like domain-containing protein
MIRSSVTKRRRRILAACGLALLLLCGWPATVWAAKKAPSGMALPRFVSILGDKVNLRTGPGARYPVAWVFVRANLPVLVTLEFENWRKVRDLDGAEGWVHRSLLTGRRHGVITGQVRLLRRAPRPDSPVLLRAEPGVIGRLLACRGAWCRMEIGKIDGWLPQAHLFGALAGEAFE